MVVLAVVVVVVGVVDVLVQDTYELDDAADEVPQGDVAPEDDYEDEDYGGGSVAEETQALRQKVTFRSFSVRLQIL
eukprot:s5109_g7.t1